MEETVVEVVLLLQTALKEGGGKEEGERWEEGRRREGEEGEGGDERARKERGHDLLMPFYYISHR